MWTRVKIILEWFKWSYFKIFYNAVFPLLSSFILIHQTNMSLKLRCNQTRHIDVKVLYNQVNIANNQFLSNNISRITELSTLSYPHCPSLSTQFAPKVWLLNLKGHKNLFLVHLGVLFFLYILDIWDFVSLLFSM